MVRDGWMLIINEIHEDKNVGNYLIPTSGDFKDLLSKHTFIFGASKRTHYVSSGQEAYFYFTDLLLVHNRYTESTQ